MRRFFFDAQPTHFFIRFSGRRTRHKLCERSALSVKLLGHYSRTTQSCTAMFEPRGRHCTPIVLRFSASEAHCSLPRKSSPACAYEYRLTRPARLSCAGSYRGRFFQKFSASALKPSNNSPPVTWPQNIPALARDTLCCYVACPILYQHVRTAKITRHSRAPPLLR